MLLEWINKNPEIVNLLAEMAERKVYNWARTVRKEVFVPLLEKIAELKINDKNSLDKTKTLNYHMCLGHWL